MADRPMPRSAARALWGFALVFAVTAAALAWLHSATGSLYGYDGYFHIRYAEVLRSEGVSRSFPWWQETFLRDHWADKDFLFHVLLIPFTFGDLTAGAKLASILFGSAVVGVFFLTLRVLKVPWPEAWSLGFLAASTAFIYRLGFTRPSIAAVGLAVAGTGAILAGKRRWAFALAALYPHVHISYHLLPCIAVLHDLHRVPEPGRRRSFAVTGWTAAGALTGAVVTPYFPNNLYLWWVQNLRVLELAWSRPEGLGMGLEIRPGSSDQLLLYNLGVFLALAAAVYMIARRKSRASPEALTLLVVSCGFLGLSMMSRRFIEFLAPFCLLLAGVAGRDLGLSGAAGRLSTGARRWIAVGCALLVAALLGHDLRAARRIVREDPGPVYEDASTWMGFNIGRGERIFQVDWDDFPQLFFFNPQFRYMVGLDPSFMYVTSPSRWRLWQTVIHGETDDVYDPVREVFDSRWAFASHDEPGFLAAARRDPRFFPRYEDDVATVYFLADGFHFIDQWKLAGWYPNPSRRLFDDVLGPEPVTPGRARGPAAWGPQEGSLIEARTRGFVNLAKLLRVPPGQRGACGVALARVRADASEPAKLCVATDDEFRLYLNGTEIASHSPLLDPPAGTPGGPALDLEEIEGTPHRAVGERKIDATLRAGINEIAIKVCATGDDFGFFLRVLLEDGTNLPAAGFTSD